MTNEQEKTIEELQARLKDLESKLEEDKPSESKTDATNTSSRSTAKTGVLITLLLVALVAIVGGVAYYGNQERVRLAAEAQDRVADEIGIEIDSRADTLAKQYYKEGKTKKEAIQLMVDRGISRYDAEVAIKRHWK